MIIASVAVAGCTGETAEPAQGGSANPSQTPKAGPKSDYPGMGQLPPDVEDDGAANRTPTPQPTSAAPSAPADEAPDFKALAGEVGSGVFSVVASGCGDGSKIGSAFLIGKKTAVTSWAVVDGANVAALTSGSEVVAAEVRAASPESGVAILQLDHEIDGHVFTVADEAPEVGDPVGLLGVESGTRKVSMTTSEITETDVALDPQSMVLAGVAKAGVEIDPGRGGGPTLNADGEANGMALGGTKPGSLLVVGGSELADAIDGAWPQPTANCDKPTGPNVTVVAGDAPDAVRELFNDYFGGINTADYRQAYDRLGPLSRSENDFDGYRAGWVSSYDFDITVHQATSRRAHVTFHSVFQAGKGPAKKLTCARWNVDYTLTKDDGRLLINKAEGHDGGKLWRPCD